MTGENVDESVVGMNARVWGRKESEDERDQEGIVHLDHDGHQIHSCMNRRCLHESDEERHDLQLVQPRPRRETLFPCTTNQQEVETSEQTLWSALEFQKERSHSDTGAESWRPDNR